MSKDFVHLHTHSHYSLLSALPKVDELVLKAKEEGMPALALTDSGNLYGAIEFYKTCKKNDIKPILGVDFYVAPRKISDKDTNIDKPHNRLVLLAKDKDGYQNLIRLVTKSFLEGFLYKPRIDKDLIKEYSSSLIAISPSLEGRIANLVENKPKKALEEADFLKSLFGDDFYIEVTDHPAINGHQKKMEELVNFSKKNNFSVVAAHNIYYLKPSQKRARNTLVSIQSDTDLRGRFTSADEDFSFLGKKEMLKRFKDLPEAIQNIEEIVKKIDIDLDLGGWVFPKFEVPKGSTYNDELRKLVDKGIEARGIDKNKEVSERMEYELKIIKDKGYAPYFLVVADLLKSARQKKILTTIRGSVAGSLVTYLAGITNVNPLDYKLPFERFLNPERPSAPDIDMDFADNRRDEMIDYAKEKYGENKVAQIGTFGTMLARGAVRDVARALGYSYNDGDRLAKLIPFGSQGFPMTIKRALEMEPELKKIYKEEEEAADIIDTAREIEGSARHISVHAAGVVISPTILTDYVPLQLDPKGGKKITQYDMHSVEDAGLMKFDFLGLKNLAILADSVRIVKKLYGEKVDIENIPLDDDKTFKVLSEGRTMGVFQLSGQAMTHYLKALKPSSIHDINAMVALYRPGPMESIPEYIERKHNPKKVKYLDPRMKDILDQSYGVITYQDDVMLIAIKLGGFSWLEADKLRKAMGKKIPKVMAAQKEKLISGLVENGMSEKKADKLWKLIEPFAAYGFNKAHAASYGRVAYQTAYMKANYTAAYMSAVLTADAGDVEKVAEMVKECQNLGLDVLPPDINESLGNFTVIEKGGNEKIRFGLHSIKNFGHGVADTIIEERKKNGKFKSISDFLDRIQDRNLNKRCLEALIKSGALDKLGERGALLANLEGLLDHNREVHKHQGSQDSIFSLMDEKLSAPEIKLKEAPKASTEDKLLWEKELLGLYISGHPLDKFKDRFDKSDTDIEKLKEKGIEGASCVVAGIIESTNSIHTKNGDRMAFLKLSDFSGSVEVVVFPRVFQKNKSILEAEKCIALKGKFSKRDGEASIVLEKVKELK